MSQDELIQQYRVAEQFHLAQYKKALAMREKLEAVRPASSTRKGDELRKIEAAAEARYITNRLLRHK